MKHFLSLENHKKWLKLDNAALIFPTIIKKNWSNVFRLSITFDHDVDKAVLTEALKDIKRRYPSFFVRLRQGAFWFYLEECPDLPPVIDEFAYPLTQMTKRDLFRSCLRFVVFHNRLAVEIFHSVTDGNGGAWLLQNVAAEYLRIKYTTVIEPCGYVRDAMTCETENELEDAFQKYAGKYKNKSTLQRTYRPVGTPLNGTEKVLITGTLNTQDLLTLSKRYHATMTVFLASVLIEQLIEMQNATVPEKRQKQILVTVPVNLRKLFQTATLRNFILTVDVGIHPRTGEYTLQEICDQITHQLKMEAVPQKMSGRILENVAPQRVGLVRLVPLFIKIPIMRAVYNFRGETSTICLSNIGDMVLPDVMKRHVKRMEFITGPQMAYVNNCAVLSYDGKTYINMIRSVREATLERHFFSRLVELGVGVEIESNERSQTCTVSNAE